MARSPLVVDITELKRHPGLQRPFVLSLAAPADLALESAEVSADELRIDLLLEIAASELIAAGTITVDWTGPCRRCIEPQHGSISFAVHEIFQRQPVDGETYALAENDVDLEPMVREAVLLSLPIAPLCSPDCAGPDPSRFPTSAEADGDVTDANDEPPLDPRWAALRELTFE